MTSDILIILYEKDVTWSYEKDFYELKASFLQVKVGERFLFYELKASLLQVKVGESLKIYSLIYTSQNLIRITQCKFPLQHIKISCKN